MCSSRWQQQTSERVEQLVVMVTRQQAEPLDVVVVVVVVVKWTLVV